MRLIHNPLSASARLAFPLLAPCLEPQLGFVHHLTLGYTNKAQFFVDRLAQGGAMIAAAFYPKDVIVRLSDFKSNEYAQPARRPALRAHGRSLNPDAVLKTLGAIAAIEQPLARHGP